MSTLVLGDSREKRQPPFALHRPKAILFSSLTGTSGDIFNVIPNIEVWYVLSEPGASRAFFLARCAPVCVV
jgi:hypothetical protein